MDTLSTILIWLGSGFAFAIGVFFGAWLMKSTKADNQHAMDKADMHAAEVNALLAERNSIGIRQAEAMERIADVIEGQ